EHTDQRQISFFKPFVKLSVDLLDQFVQVQVHKFQLDISGTDLGRFYQILCQLFQSLGFCIQDINVSFDLRVLDPLPFQEIHIIDDRRQRRFDIVRHIGDQVGFQTFALHLFLNRRLQAFSHTVDCLRHFQVIAAQCRQINLILQISASDPAQSLLDGLTSRRFAHQIECSDNVQQNRQKNTKSAKNADKNNLPKLKTRNYHHDLLRHLSRIVDFTAHLKNTPDQGSAPEIFSLNPSYQTAVNRHHKHYLSTE